MVDRTFEVRFYYKVGERFSVCMNVCDHFTGHNFYPIATNFSTQVGLVKIQVKFEDGLCSSHTDPSGQYQKTKILKPFQP